MLLLYGNTIIIIIIFKCSLRNHNEWRYREDGCRDSLDLYTVKRVNHVDIKMVIQIDKPT